MTIYMRGTRRIDEMAANARQLGFQENYSYTEGWDDNTVGEIFNLGLNQVYDKICQIDNVANIEEYTQDIIAGQQNYDIPQDVKMKIQIMNVRYLYGPQTWQFITLMQSMIQDRYSYPTNIPSTYCIRNGQLILSPTPNVTRQGALIVNFQKRMRKLDYRRGKVSGLISPFGNVVNITTAAPAEVETQFAHGLSTGNRVGLGGIFTPAELIEQTFLITVTSPTKFTLDGTDTINSIPFSGICIWYLCPLQFQLNFSVTSQKDTNLFANANAILDKTDWACFTTREGDPVIDAIPVAGYNMITFVVTTEPNYVIPYDAWLAFNYQIDNSYTFYILSGDYSSTHSQLDRQSEDLLIEYCVLRLLRLQSAAEPTRDQIEAEYAVLDRLAIAYRRYRSSIIPINFQKQIRTSSWFYGGRGPYR